MGAIASILLTNPQLVEASDRAGVEILAWTVDDPDIVRQLAELGVKRIVTNRLVGKICYRVSCKMRPRTSTDFIGFVIDVPYHL